MRKLQVLAGGAVAIAALALSSEPSAAQSLLQRLFGGAPRSEHPSQRMEGYGYSRWDEGGFQEDYGTYRTMCVRMCDGFYFPISDNARRGQLYRDSRRCAQRCDGEARLFFYSKQGGSVETMVDMGGRAYVDLPSAFKYRKSLVSGCSCKPAPWSPQEAARHASYAAEATRGPVEDVPDIIEERRRMAVARRMDGEGPYYEPGYAPEYSRETRHETDDDLAYPANEDELLAYEGPRAYTPWRRAPWGVGAAPGYGWR